MENMKKLGTKELSACEIKDCNGGAIWVGFRPVFIAAAITYEINQTIKGWNAYWSL